MNEFSPLKETPLFLRIGGREGIVRLLHTFYSDVRQHQVIGPIFNKQIQDWPAHIEKIAEFWSRVTGGPSKYPGGMPFKHLPLGLQPEHFRAWLDLWDFNCRRYLPQREADEMSELAHGIGARLKQIVAMHGAS